MLQNNIGSGTHGSKWRKTVVHQKPYDGTIKGRGANNEIHSETVNQREKILLKTPLEFKKKEERGKTARDLETNFTSLGSLKSYPSL